MTKKLPTREGKVIVFRRYNKVFAVHPANLNELRDKLVEDCLSRGYVPFEPRFAVDTPYNSVQTLDVAYTHSGFAGKKSAREIGVQPWPDMQVSFPYKP